MPDLRKDPTIGKWVIIATERSSRPSDFKEEPEELTKMDTCPFCEGREDKTPPEILAIRPPGLPPNSKGWQVRVVPNKFPALTIEGELGRRGIGVYDFMNGIGAHEVIVETPDHSEAIENIPVERLENILWVYKERYLDLRKDPRLKYILIFKNKGKKAGASLEHTHSQLIATPVVPDIVKNELETGLRYYQYKERCLYCDIILQELEENKRVVFENVDFMAFVPFAAAVPFEIQILPKEHSSDFAEMKLSEIKSLSETLKISLKMLTKAVPNVSYNFYIHTSSLDNLAVPYYHWHIEIVPRLTQLAGFEWGSGLYINPVPPESAAEFLINAKKEMEP